MQYTFQIIRHEGDRHEPDRFTVVRLPAAKEVVCRDLPLDEAKQAFAEFCHMPIEQLPNIEEGGIFTAYRPVRSLRDLI